MSEKMVNSPERASHLIKASEMPWESTGFDKIIMKILYRDDEGRSTIMFKMEPGAVVPLHEHTALEQTYVLRRRARGRRGGLLGGGLCLAAGG